MYVFQLTQRLALSSAGTGGSGIAGGIDATVRHSKLSTDMVALDKLVSALLERQQHSDSNKPRSASKLNPLKSLSFRHRRSYARPPSFDNTRSVDVDGSTSLGMQSMPTILEGRSVGTNSNETNSTELRRHSNVRTSVQHIVNTIKNAPHRFSHGGGGGTSDESKNLTQNVLD